MHELSIAVALVEQVEQIVRAEGGRCATTVTVCVGALSGVSPEALELAFPVACDGTLVDGARLDMRPVAARVKCGSCAELTSPDFPVFACERCGSTDVDVVSGRDLLLQSVELDTDE